MQGDTMSESFTKLVILAFTPDSSAMTIEYREIMKNMYGIR